MRFADRPTLEDVLTDSGGRANRDAAVLKACHEFGYTQAEVAAATGLHYSSVSKILRKMR
jgi:DNA-directed RNA polymerase specialized sigma24 family protein